MKDGMNVSAVSFHPKPTKHIIILLLLLLKATTTPATCTALFFYIHLFFN